jgi:hypothetical protein
VQELFFKGYKALCFSPRPNPQRRTFIANAAGIESASVRFRVIQITL